jgi:hypothetical protein
MFQLNVEEKLKLKGLVNWEGALKQKGVKRGFDV